MNAATEIPDGYVFGVGNGSVYLQSRNGSTSRVAGDQFAVSSDDATLAVMDGVVVSVYTLPGLRRLGSYAFPAPSRAGRW